MDGVSLKVWKLDKDKSSLAEAALLGLASVSTVEACP